MKPPNLSYTENSLFKRILVLFEKSKLKNFYNKTGHKWYKTQEKLTLLVFKILNQKSYRDLEFEINRRKIHFSTIQKFANNLANFLKNKIKIISKILFFQLKKQNLAIDGTGLSKCQASRHYERRVGFLKSAKLYDKLSILIDIDSLCILKFKFRVKPRHDILDGFYLICGLKCENFLADKAYSSNRFCKILFENGIIPQIPKKKNSKKGFFLRRANKHFDKCIYAKRNLVESVFSSFKRKFGERLASRKYRTKSLEISLKILFYNVSKMSLFFLFSQFFGKKLWFFVLHFLTFQMFTKFPFKRRKNTFN